MTPPSFNPLDYSALSTSLADALMASPLVPLDSIEPFYGYGVYALFYTGDMPAYSVLAKQNRHQPGSWPIYIGKSSPSSRKGVFDVGNIDTPDLGMGLYSRVAKDHRKSVEQATNLNVEDFTARLLVLSYMWVPLAETALIARYAPIWNSFVDGFGNHDPGKGRANGRMSRWDTLHPGRGRDKYAPLPQTPQQLEQEISAQLDMIAQREFAN